MRIMLNAQLPYTSPTKYEWSAPSIRFKNQMRPSSTTFCPPLMNDRVTGVRCKSCAYCNANLKTPGINKLRFLQEHLIHPYAANLWRRASGDICRVCLEGLQVTGRLRLCAHRSRRCSTWLGIALTKLNYTLCQRGYVVCHLFVCAILSLQSLFIC